MSDAEGATAKVRRWSEHDFDVSAQAEEHAKEPFSRKSSQLSREQERHLRGCVADHFGGVALRQMTIAYDRADFLCERPFRKEFGVARLAGVTTA
jgi:hypothetical protein